MSQIFDIIVIGGGIVGIGVFNRLLLNGYRNVLLVEKSSQILTGASCGNSGILHTGFDCQPGTLESKLVRQGYQLYQQLSQDIQLPIRKIGAVLVAWKEDELAILQQIIRTAHQNGVYDIEEISAERLYEMEPHLRPNALAAVSIPGECIVDPLTLPYVLYMQSQLLEGRTQMNLDVTEGYYDRENQYWTLNKGELRGRVIVNCAGLFGDQVEQIRLNMNEDESLQPSFHIQPRLGQFAVYAQSKDQPWIRSIMLPIPTKFTKGIIIYPNLFNQIIVGPTAETQEDRRRAPVRSEINALLHKKLIDLFPSFLSSDYRYIGSYTGIRPATEYSDYQIHIYEEVQWICCGGIRSTGLTSSLAIGEYVCDQLTSMAKIHAKLQCQGYSEERYNQSIQELQSMFLLTKQGLQVKLVPAQSDLQLDITGGIVFDQQIGRHHFRIHCGDDSLGISHSLTRLAWTTNFNSCI